MQSQVDVIFGHGSLLTWRWESTLIPSSASIRNRYCTKENDAKMAMSSYSGHSFDAPSEADASHEQTYVDIDTFLASF